MEPRRRFRFLKAISEGSFGKVYLAEMVTGDNFSTVVAIKLLHGKWLGHEEIVMRSRDEARLLGLLRHQNIVRVEDLSSINGQCAVIMEYLEGVDLKNMITFLTERGEIFPRRAALEAAAAIGSALDAAYNHRPLQGGKPLRVIHRDIKPSNAMITSAGMVKVLDFGTARANFEDREAKTQALAFGSQAYMAPERMMGDPDTPAADVFSLGITLWEVLAGERYGKIFIREARFQTALEQRVAQINLSMLDDDMAEQVRELMLQMMDYEPTARPTSGEVMEKLEEFAEQAPDMGLRRLCRKYVKEAMGGRVHEEVVEDPLTGTTLVEDRSSAFVRPDGGDTWSDEAQEDVGSSASLAGPAAPADEVVSGSWLQDEAVQPLDSSQPHQAAAEAPPPSDNTGSGPMGAQDSFDIPADLEEAPSQELHSESAPDGSGTGELPPQDSSGSVPYESVSEPAISGPVQDTLVPADASAPMPEVSGPVASPTPPPPKKSSKLGLGLVFAAIGLLGVVVIGGVGVGIIAFSKTDPSTTSPTTPVAQPNNTPSTPSVPVASDTVGDVELVILPSGGGAVTITSALGFKDSWNGMGGWVRKGIPAGTYRTKVKDPDGVTHRATFDVQQDKTCIYTFDLAGGSEEWRSDGCK